jgi:hypothetical protein
MKRRHYTAIQRRVSNRAHLTTAEQAQRYDRLENVVSEQAKDSLTPRAKAVLEAYKLGRFGKVRS